MKKIIFTLFTITCCTMLQAQTIDQNWAPVTTTVLRAQQLDPTGITPDGKGTGQTWNFSTYAKQGAETVSNYGSPAGTPFASNFPTANLVLPSGTNYVYYKTSASGMDLMGVGTASYVMVYSNPQLQVKFPFSYGSTAIDQFKATYSVTGFDVHRSGTVYDTADATGTLILPGNKTINNVLRLHNFQTILDSVFNSGTLVQLSYSYLESYIWILPSLQGQNLFTLSEYVSGTQDVVSSSYYSGSLTGIEDVEETVKARGMVYPNPAKDKLFIETTEGKINQVTLFDLNGKVVLKTNSFTDGIDVSELTRGIYFAEVSNSDGARSLQKIIIE